MPVTINPVRAPAESDPRLPLGQRLAWFFGLSAAGVALTGLIATALHVAMRL